MSSHKVGVRALMCFAAGLGPLDLTHIHNYSWRKDDNNSGNSHTTGIAMKEVTWLSYV